MAGAGEPIRLDILRTDDANAVTSYEQAFYAAFASLDCEALRSLWVWDDASRRIATRVSYAEQVVFVGSQFDALAAALAVNVSRSSTQSSCFGFTQPNSPDICEFLTFFTCGRPHLSSVLAFWRLCFAKLRDAEYTTAYATANDRLALLYRRCGASLVASRRFEGASRHLLRFSMVAHRLIPEAGVSWAVNAIRNNPP